MNIYIWIRDTFWHERFWLPSNYTWSDIQVDDPKLIYPTLNHLYISIPICGILILLRYLFETYLFRPLGCYYGLKEKRTRPVQPNRVLERIYRRCRRPDADQIKAAAAEASLAVRTAESWFRARRNADKYSLLKKFSESGWRFSFYLCAFVGGVSTLWSKPYLWETRYCWTDYPRQSIDHDVYWYYMIELGFYLSLLFSIFYDVKRRDFTETVVHHSATVSLIVFSWVCNFIRIGTLVLAVHDAVDYWMESAKMAKYIGKHRLCDVLFAIFTVVWLCTRMTVFPFVIIRSTLVESKDSFDMFPAYFLFNVLLFVLQALHVLWFSYILRIIYEALVCGQLQNDVRSESELSDDDSPGETAPNGDGPLKAKGYVNGLAEENGSVARRRH